MNSDFTKYMPRIAARIAKLENNRHVWVENPSQPQHLTLFIVVKEFDHTTIIPYLDSESIESHKKPNGQQNMHPLLYYYMRNKWLHIAWRFIYDSRGVVFHDHLHYYDESDIPELNKFLELLDNIIHQQSIEFYPLE